MTVKELRDYIENMPKEPVCAVLVFHLFGEDRTPAARTVAVCFFPLCKFCNLLLRQFFRLFLRSFSLKSKLIACNCGSSCSAFAGNFS